MTKPNDCMTTLYATGDEVMNGAQANTWIHSVSRG